MPDEKKPTKSTKGQKFASDKPTMAEIRNLKKPNIRKCVVLLDSSLSHLIDEKAAEIERLKRGVSRPSSLADRTGAQIDKLEAELEELENQAAELSVEFSFRDLGRKAYDSLLAAHPPTDEDQEMWKNAGGEGKLAYSLSTFPPALISAASVEPEISIEDAEAIFQDWSEGDLELIFTTALVASKEPTSLPKSRAGTARTRDLQQNSTTALNGESLTQDS